MDYHTILGVPKTATTPEIKKAYRKKAMELHPDKNKSENAEEKFIELTVAYDVLVNGKAVKQKLHKQQSPHEKFKNVYTAPTNPEEYQEWLNIAKERARQQAKMAFESFKKNNDAFRKSRYFWLAKLFSILLIIVGFGISAYIFLSPFMFAMEYGGAVVAFMAVFLCPISIWIFVHVLKFKADFDRYFVD